MEHGRVVREWRLVGRSRELAVVSQALGDDSVSGVVISGSGGVGKTRLATECLRVAADAGYATSRVAATRSAADIPLGALAPLLPDFGASAVNILAAAHAALVERAGDGRLLLLVDDAHLLDDMSAALLLHVASDRHLFVVATIRRGEPVPDAIESLWKDGHTRRLDLDLLGGDAVDELAAEVLGGAVDPATALRLRRLSEGNPLHLREILLAALESGSLAEQSGVWRLSRGLAVSPRLAELIAHRLETLDDEQRAALQYVALAEPVGITTLSRLVDPSSVAVLEERGLVDVRPDGRRVQAWLAHPLHGEVVRADLAALRRRLALGRLAEAVADTGAHRRGDELRLATWRYELGDTSDGDLLVRAARRSLVALDLPRTAQLAEAAWKGHRGVEAGHLLGHVFVRLGKHDDAERVLAEAEPLAVGDHDRVLVTMARTENLFRMGHYDDAISVNRAGEDEVTDPDWRSELVGHRATLVMLHGDPADALRIVTPMLDGSAPRPFIEAAIVAGTVLPFDGRPLDALEIVDRAFQLHMETWDHEMFQSEPGVHITSRLFALTQAGRLREAARVAEGMFDFVVAQGLDVGIAPSAFQRGVIAMEQGRVSTAATWFRRSVESFAETGPKARRVFPLSGLLLATALAGDVAAARAARAELDAERDNVHRISRPAELVGRAWLAAAEGDPEEAFELLEEAVAMAWDGAISNASLALHAMARLGRPEQAAERMEEVRPRLQGPLLGARAAHVVALAAGDAAALADAGAEFERVGALLCAAEAFADESRVHRRAGRQRESATAANRASSLAAHCEGAATPALRLTDEVVALTRREREVALLAANGMTSRVIAERLFLSPRTVDNHLQRVYDKLGVSGREGLAAALVAPQVE